nr:cupredoxin domain-containing protein [Sphingomonas vulcanisoli]
MGCSATLADPVASSRGLQLVLKDHRFSPDVITIPAGQRVKIDFSNQDATADDFDSDDLHVDKDIGPHGRIAFFIGPLTPGTYAFKGELHAATAHGRVVVLPAQ